MQAYNRFDKNKTIFPYLVTSMKDAALYLLFLSLFLATQLQAQQSESEIKIYDFDDGLSHRNVFQIKQDKAGMIWLATINGLNRFDGYQFKHFSTNSEKGKLPVDVVSDIEIGQNGELMLASPDFLTSFSTNNYLVNSKKIKQGKIIRREALAPNNLCFAFDRWWCTIYNEKDGDNWLAFFQNDSLQITRKLKSAHTNRPFSYWNKQLFFAETGHQLVQLNENGEVLKTYIIGKPVEYNQHPRIVDIESTSDAVYVLLNDGRVFLMKKGAQEFKLLKTKVQLPETTRVGALCMAEDGDIWLGGLGELWFYDSWEGTWTDYDAPIRQVVKNTCTYRQIFRDDSGTLWLSTNFGAIKITHFDNLFTQYLSGGSEYCSNVYCSTRGVTEDDEGLIYIAYYNSIHVLDPKNNAIKPLFPNNDYFNYPFGLTYHNEALYTGNGIKIDLKTLDRDTLFNITGQEGGAVMVDKEDHIWLGYGTRLFKYFPLQKQLIPFEDSQGQWDSLNGVISYLYESPYNGDVWVATLDKGVYQIRDGEERIAHYHENAEKIFKLPANKVNAIVQTSETAIWLGTGRGLVHISSTATTTDVYTEDHGLPNTFINGVLSEGDSCLWLSTDNGLCRFSLSDKACLNFFTTDGLSSNEFNRISFFKSSKGRMYFGGLNGLNAFMPDAHFLVHKHERQKAPLILTAFSYLDGKSGHIITHDFEQQYVEESFEVQYHDNMFTINFALMDFRHTEQNEFQHYLEGFENEWSEPTSVPMVRYTNLPPGEFILHVRAHAGREEWNKQELLIPISVEPAFYQRPWFWPLMVVLALGLFYAFMQMRIKALKNRREELEREVKERTKELEAEKHKSEELLLNILPAGLAEELKENGFAKAKRHEMVTVMFSDFKGFSLISEQLEPEELVAEIDLCFRAFDEITERHGLEKIKTIGDAYLLVGGIDDTSENQAEAVIKAAMEIQEFMAAIAVERKLLEHHFFEARIGIHTGPLVAGIVGIRKFAYDIWGSTVNIASRMESNGTVGKVNLSQQTFDLVKEKFHCIPNGLYTENNTEIKMYLIEEYYGGK